MFEVILLSSFEKVFKDEAPVSKGFKKFSMLKDERSSFQCAVKSDTDAKISFSVDSDLKYGAFHVGSVPGGKVTPDEPDDYYLRFESGEFPDVLYPVKESFEVKAGEWNSLWVELETDAQTKAGVHSVKVTLFCGEQSENAEVEAEVINAQLPEQELIYTSWFHSDCLMTHYKTGLFTDEYWRIVRNFVKAAVRHGQTMILTPLFTPPLDTAIGGERPTVQLVDVVKDGDNYTFGFDNLKKWVDMCLECGVKYFEMSHLFTQWGAKKTPKIIATVNGVEKQIFGWKTWAASKKYTSFLTQLSVALKAFIEKEGIKERCFFHVSDEPSLNDYRSYSKRAKLIAELFPDYRVIDALSDLTFYKKGAIKTPVPSTTHADHFVESVDTLWTYYCCGQGREYVSNRFFAMPSQRTRILGTQLYKYNAEGFLQWGYNFWFSHHSEYEIDPFTVSDAGGAFPSGDAYVVYPGEDGDALISIRLKVFYDGFQDMRALRLLESLVGREKTIEILEEGLDEPITFRNYPRCADWHMNTRERINKAISENI